MVGNVQSWEMMISHTEQGFLGKLLAGRFRLPRLHHSHGLLPSIDPQLTISAPYYSVIRAPTCWGQTHAKPQIQTTLGKTDTKGRKEEE